MSQRLRTTRVGSSDEKANSYEFISIDDNEGNDDALTRQLVVEMIVANKGRKKLLVSAAAKFISQRELSRQGVEFCQLPYAMQRIFGD